MAKNVFKVMCILIASGLLWAGAASAQKTVTVVGGGMERLVQLGMERMAFIQNLGAPDVVKCEDRCFTYDVFGLTVVFDPGMKAERIYLDKRFKGTITGTAGQTFDLVASNMLESVTVRSGLSKKVLSVGMSREDMTSMLGQPSDEDTEGGWAQYNRYDVSFLLNDNGYIQRIYVGPNFKGTVRGRSGQAVDMASVYEAFGTPTETERLAYAPSASIRTKATVELEYRYDSPITPGGLYAVPEGLFPIDEYRGHRKLYELYGQGMVLKNKYVLDEEGIAFYSDHNQSLYTIVLYPPMGEPQRPADDGGPDDTICLEIVHFDFDKSNIKSMYIPVLNKWVAYLEQHPFAYVTIEGHTDAKGSTQYNQGLSERRSRSVFRYFAKKGVDTSRLKRVGFSELEPMAPNTTPAGKDDPDGRALNRRVQFSIKQPAG